MKLRIFIATRTTINPFIEYLQQSLEKTTGVDNVDLGLDWTKIKEPEYDILLFQWPEVLTNFQPPSEDDIYQIKNAIDHWKQHGVKIFATIHNLQPHKVNDLLMTRLYELVYSNCDGLIHMGQVSVSLLQKHYSRQVISAKNHIIPHGNYTDLLPNKTQEHYKSILNVKPEKKVALVFGNIRNQWEFDYVKKFAQLTKDRGIILALVGRNHLENHYGIRYKFKQWYSRHFKNLILMNNVIKNNDIHKYILASDYLIIIRKNNLNSGNVPLGFTFGKIVIGPDYGVVGEMLRETGNPTYSTTDLRTLNIALDKAIALNKNDKIAHSNAEFARESLSWKRIGKLYYNAFNQSLTIPASR